MVPGGAEVTTNASPSGPSVNPAASAWDLPIWTELWDSRYPPGVSTGTRLTTLAGVAWLEAKNTARLSGAAAWAVESQRMATPAVSSRAVVLAAVCTPRFRSRSLLLLIGGRPPRPRRSEWQPPVFR